MPWVNIWNNFKVIASHRSHLWVETSRDHLLRVSQSCTWGAQAIFPSENSGEEWAAELIGVVGCGALLAWGTEIPVFWLPVSAERGPSIPLRGQHSPSAVCLFLGQPSGSTTLVFLSAFFCHQPEKVWLISEARGIRRLSQTISISSLY